MTEKKVIGVIGGMGPLATADLFQKIVAHTRADRDQDHLRILIDNDPGIPDRTAALLSGGADPAPRLIRSAQALERWGAQLLLIPCNTSHCFYDAVQAAVEIPILHMIRITAQVLRDRGVRRAGLLATSGTIQAGVYQKNFADIRLLTPDADGQQAVMNAIYRVKAGDTGFDTARVRQVMDGLLRQGAETLILGCTELPLLPSAGDFPVTDPTLELALAAIRAAGGETA